MAARFSAVLNDIDVAVAVAFDLEISQPRCAILDAERVGAYHVPAVDGAANFV